MPWTRLPPVLSATRGWLSVRREDRADVRGEQPAGMGGLAPDDRGPPIQGRERERLRRNDRVPDRPLVVQLARPADDRNRARNHPRPHNPLADRRRRPEGPTDLVGREETD